jgi:hypothetical protein
MNRMLLLVAGILLMATGLGLFTAGFVGLTTPIPCAINGCPSIFSSNYATNWAEISVGLGLIVSGIAMVIASRHAKVVAGIGEEWKKFSSAGEQFGQN